jgi:Domain of unknown function (DUF4157)
MDKLPHKSQGTTQTKSQNSSPTAAPILQPPPVTVAPFLQLQRTVGNQAVLSLFRSGRIQPKLRISQPGDPFEQEADGVANQVMRMSLDETLPAAPPQIHRKEQSGSTDGETSVADNFLSGLGPGQPLDAATRAFFEPRFGRDFSAVRIHTDARAAESARTVDARAFTAGGHVVFDKGSYRPHTRDGRFLLAHELAHVMQQTIPSAQTIIHRQPPQQELPKDADPRTFTVVQTKRLNGKGAFTGQVLREISGNWTQASAYGGPDVAQRAVDILESSDSFVGVANALDDFHIKKGNPKFRIFGGFTGTKFVPAGTPFQERESGPVQVVEDENTIIIDYTTSVNLFGPKPEQIVQFASSIIHESRHAYDYIKKITKSGLHGHLEEEQRTRKAEIKGLEEIKSASQDKDIRTAVDKRTAQIKQGGLTNREIAEDFISGGDGTYLETFYIGSAIDDFNSRRSALDAKLSKGNSPVPALLKKIEGLSDSNLDTYEDSALEAILLLSPEMPKGLLPPGHTVSHPARTLLFHVLMTTMTLKDLTGLTPRRLSDDEKLLLNYLLLVKAYRIRMKIREQWKYFRDDPDGKTKSEVMQKNAREFLGMPRAYAAVKD